MTDARDGKEAPRKQLGAVLVFRPGTTREQAREALASIRQVIDWDYYGGALGPKLWTFDPEHGGPVWYVP
jgi:hypothetical protein